VDNVIADDVMVSFMVAVAVGKGANFRDSATEFVPGASVMEMTPGMIGEDVEGFFIDGDISVDLVGDWLDNHPDVKFFDYSIS